MEVKVAITKNEILGKLAEQTGLKKKDVGSVLEGLNSLLAKTLKKDKKVKLPGLGIFAVKHRKARKARNPQTGEIITVKAKTVLKFRVGKELKDAVL
jgi:DNA-binding protein HU-beta